MKTKLNYFNLIITSYTFICSLLIVLSYHFLDQPLAKWVYTHSAQQYRFFTWMLDIPALAIFLTGILLCLVFVYSKLNYSSNNKFQVLVVAISFSTFISYILGRIFKYIFGRTGPEYWIIHHFNPKAYGFYLFHGSTLTYQSFPSGHTTAIFAIISVLCFAYPKYAWFTVLPGIAVVIALLITNNHFFADCIGGAFLGSMVGLLSARYFALINVKK